MSKQRSSPVVGVEHFELLHRFGRNRYQKFAKSEKDHLWKLACEAARLPYLPWEEVLEHWKQFIAGQAEHSSLAINGDIDPHLVTVGVCHDKKLWGSHTTRTEKLLEKILEIYSRTFRTEAEFLDSIEKKCKSVKSVKKKEEQ